MRKGEGGRERGGRREGERGKEGVRGGKEREQISTNISSATVA